MYNFLNGNTPNIFIRKILFSIFGILLVGIGIAFNSQSLLGNDPVGILYDGIKEFFHLTDEQRGLVSNVFNYSFIVILFFISKKYINIGTLIYTLPYGFFVDLGVKIYKIVFTNYTLITRIIATSIGCALVYIGVSIFVVVNIGVSPFTAAVLIIRDKTKLDFKKSKIIFDVIFVTIGFLLGGKLGLVTIFSVLTAGPSIQYISKTIGNSKLYKKIF